MSYLLEFTLGWKDCSTVCVCLSVWERLILAELGIALKFKQNIIPYSLSSCAISKICISWHPRKCLWIILLSLSLPFWDRTQTLVSVLQKDHLLCPCLESRDKLYMCMHTWKGTSIDVKEDLVHKLYCLQKNGCILPVCKRIQLNCNNMD